MTYKTYAEWEGDLTNYLSIGDEVDEALELIGFDEQKFIKEHGFDDIDYNDFKLIY